ncbi:nitric oxide synthase oxygenase [Micromonospora echinofusca]|uniref:Nitric oxide synthase oxygenase n=1 Tax=Micromonospora echinofusca TaxID=47858 RepID=A0ABS3VN05_MICEH|nr:nitric oxide synthase oxygenase [Micromonospora echinofusca]MBO4205910.1 nitric oxide synthase oxygenase [Micromonospora echinofusca]
MTAAPVRAVRVGLPPVRETGGSPGEADPVEAEEFIRQHHAEDPRLGPPEPRLEQVRWQIATTGTYRHTPAELSFGARVAWRNSANCIGRLYWRSLRVRDLRAVDDPWGVFVGCVNHLKLATNGGRIRPVITVFAPDLPDRPGPRIVNDQLIRYAGYREPDGSLLGDPRNEALTATALSLGWRAPAHRGRFDLLPLVVQTANRPPLMARLPADVVHEVPITHPELPELAELGLRWHSVPAISNMRLRIGGITYPAAPFNGWYMGTEIGARNFADTDRYNLLPVVAEMLKLDTSAEHTLWRDRAMVEINRAVLYSYHAAGVTITDHHTESARFITHLRGEERAGRSCPADWSWIVPPMSASQTPVFHRYYDTQALLPNFLPAEPEPVARCPFTTTNEVPAGLAAPTHGDPPPVAGTPPVTTGEPTVPVEVESRPRAVTAGVHPRPADVAG